MMTIYVIAALAQGAVATAAVIALALDRSARERAWREIAVERRWNHDRYLQER